MEVLDFQTEVVDKSYEVPVVVDFWAPWCGPCKALGPVIEGLAAEANGQWVLAKVNTDQHQDIAEALQIMSIPAVKMIYQGKIIAEFVGAIPKPQIVQWLMKNLPDLAAIEEDDDKSEDNIEAEKLPEPDEILPKITQVPDPEFILYLDDYLALHPESEKARVYKATHVVFSDPAEAEELTKNIKEGNPLYDLVSDVRTLATFFITEFEDSGTGRLLTKAKEDIDHGRSDKAMERIIESMHTDKSYQNEIARKTGIALFHIFGKNHPVTKSQRKYFDMAVY